jgi:transcriptional regulator with XRE-family HTH domain
MPTPTPARAGEQPPKDAKFASQVLAGNLRAYRLLRQFEQVKVAERMNSLGHRWFATTVSEVERGRRNVSVDELLGLCLVLGATIEQLLDPRGPERGSGPKIVLSRHPSHHRDGVTVYTSVDGKNMSALVCSHRMLKTALWRGSEFIGFEFLDGHPGVEDVRPDETRPWPHRGPLVELDEAEVSQ